MAPLFGTIEGGRPVEGVLVGFAATGERRVFRFGRLGRKELDVHRLDLVLAGDGPGGTDRAVGLETWVPDHLVCRLALGSSLLVVVDPADPDHVEIDWWASAGEHAALGALSRSIGPDELSQWPMCGLDPDGTVGWPATVVVRSVYASGFRVGHLIGSLAVEDMVDAAGRWFGAARAFGGLFSTLAAVQRTYPDVRTTDPVLALHLRATLTTGAVVDSRGWHRIPPAHLARVVPGVVLPAYVSPSAPTRRVHLVWT